MFAITAPTEGHTSSKLGGLSSLQQCLRKGRCSFTQRRCPHACAELPCVEGAHLPVCTPYVFAAVPSVQRCGREKTPIQSTQIKDCLTAFPGGRCHVTNPGNETKEDMAQSEGCTRNYFQLETKQPDKPWPGGLRVAIHKSASGLVRRTSKEYCFKTNHFFFAISFKGHVGEVAGERGQQVVKNQPQMG